MEYQGNGEDLTRDGSINDARAGGTSDSSGNPPAIFFRDHDDESYEAERLQLVNMGFPDAAIMPHASYMLEHATISHLRPYLLRVADRSNSPGIDQVHSLMTFDRRFQSVLFKYIGVVETQFRAQYAHLMNECGGAFSMYDKSLFLRCGNYRKSMSLLEKELERKRKRGRSIARILDENDGRCPVGVAVEVMSLGLLSQFYNNTRPNDVTGGISRSFGVTKHTFSSWIKTMTQARNIMAHFGPFAVLRQIPATPLAIENVDGDTRKPFYLALILSRLVSQNRWFSQREYCYSYMLYLDFIRLMEETPEDTLGLLDIPGGWRRDLKDASCGQVLTCEVWGSGEKVDGEQEAEGPQER